MQRKILLAALVAAAPLTAFAQSGDSTVARNLAASCAMCHGTEGRSAGGNEPLAGMAKDEMVRKINEFRSGAKPATVMHQLSKGYTDQQIASIAAYFAAQRK